METLIGFIKNQEVAPVTLKKSSNLVANKTFKDSSHFLTLRQTGHIFYDISQSQSPL